MQQCHKANYFYFDFFLICGNLRRFVAFPYKLLNVAEVIIMHSVPMSLLCIAWKKQSNLCAVLNVSLASCGYTNFTRGYLSNQTECQKSLEPFCDLCFGINTVQLFCYSAYVQYPINSLKRPVDLTITGTYRSRIERN